MKAIKNHKNTIRIIAVIFGVVLIPLLYSFFYLKAFWDPYGKINDISVAVVNVDKGAVINNEKQNMGKELANELKENDTLNFIITNNNDAREGLYNKKYYAMIYIPEDFSQKISTTTEDNKKVAKITYSPNEKRNYIATQILNNAINRIEQSTQRKITEEIVGTLTQEIEEVPNSLNQLNNGLITLSSGTNKLSNGTFQLLNGTKQLSNNYKVFNDSISMYNDGIIEYTSGVSKINDGINLLKSGTDKLVENTEVLSNISEKSPEIVKNVELLDTSVKMYTTNVNTLIDNYNSTIELINTIALLKPEIKNNDQINKAIEDLNSEKTKTTLETLKTKGNELSYNVNSFNKSTTPLIEQLSNLNELQKNIKLINEKISELQIGSNTLNSKSELLRDSSEQLKNGSNKINDGINTIYKGNKKINTSLEKIDTGTKTIQTNVESNLEKTESKTSKLKGLDKQTASTVSIEKKSVETVPNYGTGFAPYFMSLSLYVGAIIILFGIYYDSENSFNLLSRNSNKPITRAIGYYAIGILQAIVLGIILKYMLGLEVKHFGYYYLSMIVASLTFVSIVQFLIISLKDIGKLLTMLLLILQLTSCGGTFPMETLPKFFNVIYPFMPMTYSVELFRETISAEAISGISSNMTILIIIFIVVTIITLLKDILIQIKKQNKKVQ